MEAQFERYCTRFGKRVRELRLERELTQEDMMDRGFSLRHYQRIEAGPLSHPRNALEARPGVQGGPAGTPAQRAIGAERECAVPGIVATVLRTRESAP